VTEPVLPAFGLLAAVLLAAAGMLAGWRRRVRAQGTLGPVRPVPADPGAPSVTAEVLYVATTLRDRPLERVVVQGLAMRSRATVQAFDAGLALALAGRDAVWIPAEDLTAVGRATYAIDRVVEPDGLLLVRWILGGTPVDTFLRPPAAADVPLLLDAIQRIPRCSIASTPDPSESEN
jgi:hypothetical protein